MSDRHEETTSPLAGGVPGPEGKVDGPAISAEAISPETASLLALIDRLGSLLERSDLEELEVEAGETGIVLRKSAAPAPLTSPAGIPAGAGTDGSVGGSASGQPAPVATVRTVKAPLTGIFYGSSSPGSPPYVTVGQRIAVGHDRQSAGLPELLAAEGFPIRVTVFVVGAQAAHIAETCEFDSWSNPHETSRNLGS